MPLEGLEDFSYSFYMFLKGAGVAEDIIQVRHMLNLQVYPGAGVQLQLSLIRVNKLI